MESVGAAFKAASVINTQYGVTLEDVALSTALLNNLNIQNGAAGTQIRNMYADLAGRTPKVTAALKSLGVEAFDPLTGKAKPLVETVKQLAIGLEKFPLLTQNKKFQDAFSERGGKPGSALLAGLRQMTEESLRIAKEGGIAVETYIESLQAKILDNVGFVALASVRMLQTPLNQLKSVKSATEAFDALQPQVLQFSRDMKQVFASEEYKEGLKRMAGLVADITLAFVKWGDVILVLAGSLFALKAAMGIGGMLTSLAAGATAAGVSMSSAAVAARQLAASQLAAAQATAASNVAGLANTSVLSKSPVTGRESFDLMVEAGILEQSQADVLKPAVGLRNILVHMYADIDLDILADSSEAFEVGFSDYVRTVAQWLLDSTQ